MIITFLSIGINNIYAATGYQGYAVYRDGVGVSGSNIDWHAGIMHRGYSFEPEPVIHHSGSGYVKRDSLDSFIYGNNFKGVYRPKTNPSNSYRDLFVAKARELETENINYDLTHQVFYSPNNAGTWIDADEIWSIRCDGVVEYIYEWYSFRVYGTDDKWDITKNDISIRDDHAFFNITPSKQVASYLTLVTTQIP